MKVFLTLLVILFFLAVGLAVYVGWGFYDVSADVPHSKLTQWFLETVRERSIDYHSKGVSLPPLVDPKFIEVGFPHYHEMCRLCHGAPGYKREEFAEGLNPSPPDLISKEVQELPDRELFWIVQNGIKMTGMPAFSPTHTREQMIGIVAFLRRLPMLTPEDYKSMVKALELEEEEHKGR